MTSREIALELLEKYVDSELDLISELSFDFTASKQTLEKRVEKYLKKLDALNQSEKFKNMIWNCY